MSKSHLSGRLLARAQALQVLFQAEATGRPVDRILADEYVVTDGPIDDYGRDLALAVYDRRGDLDLVLGTPWPSTRPCVSPRSSAETTPSRS